MNPPGDSGFTLIEALVATVLLAMIATVAAGGLRLGARSVDGAEARAAAALERRVLRGFLIDLIESVDAPRLRDGSRTPPALFRGDAAGFTTVARLPAALADPAPQLVRLAAQGGALTLAWAPLDDRRPDLRMSDGETEPLAEGLDGVVFSYGPEGLAGYADQPNPPELISLTIDYGDATETLAATPRAARR